MALLEMSGIRNERQATEVDQLNKDKKRLTDRLKKEVRIMVIKRCGAAATPVESLQSESAVALMAEWEQMKDIGELCQDDES